MLTVTAIPASLAAGKKLTVTDPQGILYIDSDSVFDDNGNAQLNFCTQCAGLTNLTLGIEGEAVSAQMTVISIETKELKPLELSEKPEPSTEPEIMLGDLD